MHEKCEIIIIIIIIVQGLLYYRLQVHVFNPLNYAIGLCLHSLIKNALFSNTSSMSIQTFPLAF